MGDGFEVGHPEMESFPQKKQVLHSFGLVIHKQKSSKNNLLNMYRLEYTYVYVRR